METCTVKLLVPDWMMRKKGTYNDYHKLKVLYKKNNKDLSVLWNELVKQYAPKNIELSDWKSFLRKKEVVHELAINHQPNFIIPTKNTELDMLEDVKKRVSEEAKALGGGNEEYGLKYLEKYLKE
jgi:hypothetical protein